MAAILSRPQYVLIHLDGWDMIINTWQTPVHLSRDLKTATWISGAKLKPKPVVMPVLLTCNILHQDRNVIDEKLLFKHANLDETQREDNICKLNITDELWRQFIYHVMVRY